MSNKCLVTKLKAVVNNDSLEKFGHFTIGLHHYTGTPPENNRSGFKFDSPASCKLLGTSGSIIIGGQTVNVGDTYSANLVGSQYEILVKSLSVEDSDMSLDVSNIYDLTGIYDAGGFGQDIIFDWKDSIISTAEKLQYLSKLKYIDMPRISGNVSDLVKLKQFRENPEATRFWSYNCTLVGKIEEFAPWLYVTSLNIQHGAHTLYGAVEDLAAAQVALGRISGQLTIFVNGAITMDGTAISNGGRIKITYDSSYQGGYQLEHN